MGVPIQYSPIHALTRSGSFIAGDQAGLPAVAIVDRSNHCLIMVEGPAADELLMARGLPRPREIGRGERQAHMAVFCLRADQFAVFTSPNKAGAVWASLRSPLEDEGRVAVTDVTHGRAQIQILGPAATGLLARVCALDLHPTRFANLSACRTSVANTTQLILRDDFPTGGAAVPAFVLVGARSLGTYLWDVLLEAGVNLGARPLEPDDLNELVRV